MRRRRRRRGGKGCEAGGMWVFYLISLPLTLGLVSVTLRYFAGPDVPRYVLFTVGYAWFCSLSIIILVPADIWTTIIGHDKGGIAFFWAWSYWSTFALTWAVVPTIQGYEDAGDFTVTERLKTSVHGNLVFYVTVGSIGLFGVILLIIMHKHWSGGVVGLAMACSNTFGLVTGAFLLGFGLSEIPKSIWRNADWGTRQKILSHRVAKMAVNLDNAHQDLSNAIVIAQATSNQMSKRDPLRPYMDVIDDMLLQMFREDPTFKPTGGRLGENDMDYDADEKSMATLRRQLTRAREEYYRYRSEYMTYVMEALELEDTIKSYERGSASGWKYVSSFRSARTGSTGEYLDTIEWIWRCVLTKQLEKLLAVLLGCISAAILLAEATLLPSVDLSLFSILIKAVGKQEMLVQRMGNIDDAVPFFGRGFNRIYPLIMVVYTLLVASNFFDKVINFFGSWKRLRFQNDTEDMDGFDPSGVIILQKERSWLEKGSNVGEHVIPLARNFNDVSADAESGNLPMIPVKNVNDVAENDPFEMKSVGAGLSRDDRKGFQAVSNGDRRYENGRESILSNYGFKDQQGRQPKPSASASLQEAGNLKSGPNLRDSIISPSGLANTWTSMKTNFQNFRANLEAKRFLPLRQTQENMPNSGSKTESLDEIFERLKKHPERGRDDDFCYDD
ncbi:domain-containing 2-like protein A [Nymphaea thermarum]|nr:domain-containing 2-like protein A [Nymphaea thermarum]